MTTPPLKKPLIIRNQITVEDAERLGVNTKRSRLKNGKIRVSYENIPKGNEGWVPCVDFLPVLFDVVDCKTEKGKIFPGWRGVEGWFGLRMRKGDLVVFWRSQN